MLSRRTYLILLSYLGEAQDPGMSPDAHEGLVVGEQFHASTVVAPEIQVFLIELNLDL